MYEQFSDYARKVIQLASIEAQMGNHEFIGTGHILLSIMRTGDPVAARALHRIGCNLSDARIEVARIVQSAPHSVIGRVPLNQCAQQAVEFAQIESKKRNETLVSVTCLLLGVLDDINSVAVKVLNAIGLSVEDVVGAITVDPSDPEEE